MDIAQVLPWVRSDRPSRALENARRASVELARRRLEWESAQAYVEDVVARTGGEDGEPRAVATR